MFNGCNINEQFHSLKKYLHLYRGKGVRICEAFVQIPSIFQTVAVVVLAAAATLEGFKTSRPALAQLSCTRAPLCWESQRGCGLAPLTAPPSCAAVKSIKKQHLVEVRSMANPPAAVKLALESICLLLGESTTDWKQIRSIIMRENFIPTIVNFSAEEIRWAGPGFSFLLGPGRL